MWEPAHTEFPGDFPGDVEMTGHHGHDFEDNGVPMGAPDKQHQERKGGAGKYICYLVVVVAIAAAGVAFAYGPEFGLPSWVGGDSGDDEDTNHKDVVDKDSIINNPSYEVILKAPVESVEGDVVIYKHKKTKTPVMTILPYDTEQDSVFAISYRTVPTNSHGAAHVLEHSVLAGSVKYPVKDPFTQAYTTVMQSNTVRTKVLKGSLTTFVNAMTFNDLTAYMCASRNDVDMQNLMSVYLDAVFQPLVVTDDGNWIFRQEGWRVDENATGFPVFNGVVYSEMKGAMSDPIRSAESYSMAQLFPNVTYRFISGGDPKVIPQLSQEELSSFYNTFYHPSNAQAYFYGTKTSAKNLLAQLDDYLQNYDARPDIRTTSTIDLQPSLDVEPKVHQVPYAADEQETDHKIWMSWLVSGDGTMDDEFQHENRLAYSVLAYLLMNDPNGVLFKALQDSGLGSSIDGDIDKSIRQWTFDLTMSNIVADNIQAVQNVVVDTLENVVKEGFHKEDIESAMNTVEFSFRDISSSSDPRGITMWMGIMETWKFDLHPLTGLLSFEEDLARLKEKVGKHGSGVFTKIIKDNILSNQHSIVIDLYPDPTLAATQAQDEENRMIALRQTEKFQGLLDESEALQEIQVADDPPELIAKIPSVTVDDLSKSNYEPPMLIDEDREGTGVPVLVHEVVSSFGIIYVDFGVDVSTLDFEDIVLLPLFARLMRQAGTDKYSNLEIAREIGKNTGGVATMSVFEPILSENATTSYLVPDGEHLQTKLFLRTASMKEKADKLFDILSQIMFSPKLDAQDLAISVLRDQISGMEDTLAAGGISFANKRLQCRYSPYHAVAEKYSGLSSLPKLREILESAQNDWGSVLARLEKMKESLLKGDRRGMVLNLTGDKNVLKHVTPLVTHFLEHQLPSRSDTTSLPNFAKEVHPWIPKAKAFMSSDCPVRNEGIVSTAMVNFVGKGGQVYKTGEEVPGSMAVVSQFVEYNNFFLQIRERRGAYGAFAQLDKWTGIVDYFSYRDPNLGETLQVYSEVPTYLDDQMKNAATAIPLINSAIVGSIGQLDGSAPQPNTVGYDSLLQWLRGSTKEVRQGWREQVLKTDNNDFLEYAKLLRSWEPTLSISGPRSVLEKEKGLNLTLLDLLS